MRYLLLTALLLTNCQPQDVDPTIAEEIAETFICSLGAEKISIPDGFRFLTCDIHKSDTDKLNRFLQALNEQGITYETDFSFDSDEFGMAMANHTHLPEQAHVHLSYDSMNCYQNGEGPLHCTDEGKLIIVPDAAFDWGQLDFLIQ